MPFVPNHDLFIQALTVYIGDNWLPAHIPGAARVAEAFPGEAAELMHQIQAMKDACNGLPGLWTEPMLGLHDAVEVVQAYVATEYGFLPADLQSKVVSQMAWVLR